MKAAEDGSTTGSPIGYVFLPSRAVPDVEQKNIQAPVSANENSSKCGRRRPRNKTEIILNIMKLTCFLVREYKAMEVQKKEAKTKINKGRKMPQNKKQVSFPRSAYEICRDAPTPPLRRDSLSILSEPNGNRKDIEA